MLNDLVKRIGNGNSSGSLKDLDDGIYEAEFVGYREAKRATYETRLSETPEFEECIVFTFALTDEEAEASIWVRKATLWAGDGAKNKPRSALYRTLCELLGKRDLEKADLTDLDAAVNGCVGKRYQIVLESTTSGWKKITKVIPLKPRKAAEKRVVTEEVPDEEIPF
jgi:hypothetical protein